MRHNPGVSPSARSTGTSTFSRHWRSVRATNPTSLSIRISFSRRHIADHRDFNLWVPCLLLFTADTCKPGDECGGIIRIIQYPFISSCRQPTKSSKFSNKARHQKNFRFGPTSFIIFTARRSMESPEFTKSVVQITGQ